MTRADRVSPRLLEEDAAEIVRRYDAGEAQHPIAAALGVNQGRISEIVNGKRFPRAREIARPLMKSTGSIRIMRTLPTKSAPNLIASVGALRRLGAMLDMHIDAEFKDLTGFAPLSWQARLYREHLAGGAIPSAVDVPTGLGKTSVITLWLIARAHGAPLPRRLVYVVDRRAVVDQATEEAVKLRDALEGEARHLKEGLGLGDRKLPISTLRGAHADNREWLDDPAAPAIVVGTVDMIGSRLLFEGYGVSRKMRPFQAGLLGVDTLIVLDEAHLVPPFAHLLRAIEADDALWPRAAADRALLPRFTVLPLSATQRDAGEAWQRANAAPAAPRKPFRLQEEDERADEIVRERLSARKRLSLRDLGTRKLEAALADEVWRLSDEGRKPIRCIVFCDSREVAEKVSQTIEKKAAQRKGGPLADVELFVGARRVHERKEAADWLCRHGFIAAKVELTKPAFLIATAAGEVGVDIDADHMVSDLVAWERMVQRLGRVNRRGKGDAEVVVLWSEPPPLKNADAPSDAERRAQTAFAAKAAVERLPLTDGTYDASPGALRRLAEDARNDASLATLIKNATTHEPLRPALSRALVDAWSMTSLKAHAGRPEVGPWLRGWVEELPQTTVVWRRYLPLRIGEKGRFLPSKAEIEEFFEAAPPHESERLETETHRVVSWLKDRATALLKDKAQAAQAVDTDETTDTETTGDGTSEQERTKRAPESEALKHADVAVLILSPGGSFERHSTLGELAQERKGNAKDAFLDALAGRIVVVDARLAGWRDGLLSEGSSDPVPTADADAEWSQRAGFRVRPTTSLSGDDEEKDWPREHAFALRRDSEGEAKEWLVVEHFKTDAQEEDGRSISSTPQELAAHQGRAGQEMERIARSVGLPEAAVRALALGALRHDEGKKAPRWQRAFKAARDAKKYGLALPLAKTRGPIDQAILDGYRHELGSLIALEESAELKALPEGWRDIVLHLVAAHHGGARPVIETKSCESGPPSQLEERAREVALRFARLQRRWGPWGLAWWEALLRAADVQASRENDAGGDGGARNGGAPRGSGGVGTKMEG